MSLTPRVVLLVAFDRSGSSMVSKVLARHPGVNVLFQPFNGTAVHRSQWEIWSPDHAEPATEAFLSGLLQGEVEADYIASDWFGRHSSSLHVEPGAVNLVKDTKLHFQIPWLKQRFPSLEVLGLSRDPRAILASLVRNDFHRTWYGGDHFAALCRTLCTRPELAELHRFVPECSTDLRRMALMLAVRNGWMLRQLEPAAVIRYEDLLRDPDAGFGAVVERWGLAPVPFAAHLREDHNIAGAPFERADLWHEVLRAQELPFLEALFRSAGLELP